MLLAENDEPLLAEDDSPLWSEDYVDGGASSGEDRGLGAGVLFILRSRGQ